MKGRRIAIVGGGLAGLTAAYALTRRGAEVHLFEAEGRLGGRAFSVDLDGLRVDPGAQLYASMYSRFIGLAREVGLGDRLVRVPGRDALWKDGRAHEVVYGSVTSMATSGGLPIRTKLRLAATYVPYLTRHAGSLEISRPELAALAGLDRESIAAWGRREMDEDFLRSLVYPQLGAYYAALPEDTSAGFYHTLARHGMDVELYAFAGGVGQLAYRLADRIEEAGGRVSLRTPIRELKLKPSPRLGTESGPAEFDAIVAAIPAPDLLPLLTEEPASLRHWLQEVRYGPALALVLVLRRRSDRRFFGLSFPRGANRFVVAVTLQENKGIPLSDDGRGLLIAFAAPEAAPDLLEMEDQEVLDRMLPEISAALPGTDDWVQQIRVFRWKSGAPLLYPGYLAHLGRFRDGDPEAGASLVLAGDYLYGPSVEGAVLSGLAAAERLAHRLTHDST